MGNTQSLTFEYKKNEAKKMGYNWRFNRWYDYRIKPGTVWLGINRQKQVIYRAQVGARGKMWHKFEEQGEKR